MSELALESGRGIEFDNGNPLPLALTKGIYTSGKDS